MRPKKRSQAAKDREKRKKQRIDPLNAASEGSQYNPSDCESTDSQDDSTKNPACSQPAQLEQARKTLYDLWESQSDDTSESDGETMLGLDNTFNENDWDPDVVPDIYPIFTEPVKTFKFAEKTLRAPEAASCSDLRSFFLVKQKITPAGGADVPENAPPIAQEPPAPMPTAPCSIAVVVDPEADNNYRSLATLSPCLSSYPSSPLSRSPSLEPNASNLGQNLPLDNELNMLALEDEPDPPTSPMTPVEDDGDVASGATDEPSDLELAPRIDQAPIPETPPQALKLGDPDESTESRLKKLRTQLTTLKKQMERGMRLGKQKVDPRDPADIQVLLDYCTLVEQLVQEGCRSPEMTSSLQIARTKVSTIMKDGDVISKGAWYARTLRSKAKHVHEFGILPARRQGKGAAHSSLLDNPLVSKAVNAFLDKAEIGKVTPRLLMIEVNTKILPPLALSKSTISENTAKKWLLQLGFRRTTYKKGIYMDGHERPDVVAYQTEFLNEVGKYKQQMQQYSDKDCEPLPFKLPARKCRIIAAFHDECCFHANDQTTSYWVREGQSVLRQKSRGRLIHVSDIIVEETGRLVLSEEEIKAQQALPENQCLQTYDARKIIYPGKNQAAYWDMPQLVAQVKDAIKIFKLKFPGTQMLLFVDQSSAHNAYAADALNARKMNVTP
ncbi:hypothetical protein OPQ81_005269 [Rhizoctonia solani]|nr:hypothetical protein OPQ81_005269 [Rhizoctonia solani]